MLPLASRSTVETFSPASSSCWGTAETPGLRLRQSNEEDGFTTLDVINGLRGVCVALDDYVATNSCPDVDQAANLSMAANVLSAIIADRVEI